ncbi:MAG: hypothetical protein ACI9MB_005350 [Verrucomicrobiales bacterium]|jgi:hypothetical protein
MRFSEVPITSFGNQGTGLENYEVMPIFKTEIAKNGAPAGIRKGPAAPRSAPANASFARLMIPTKLGVIFFCTG